MADRIRIKPVLIHVHPNFFNWFEKERKSTESKYGFPLSQTKFTEMISHNNLKIELPKIPRASNKFAPRGLRRRRLL